MLELCGYMGSFSTACMETVLDQSTVRFIQVFKSELCCLLIVNTINVVDSWVFV